MEKTGGELARALSAGPAVPDGFNGAPWSWDHDPFSATITYKHRETGLYTILDADQAHRMAPDLADLIAAALYRGVRAGITGQVVVSGERHRQTGQIGETWLVRPGVQRVSDEPMVRGR